MRTTFANTIFKKACENKNIMLLTADLGFRILDEFRCELPEQFVNVGVAEQNMISVAAGLSLCGKKVYCYSMVPFLIMRAFEQIRIDICSQGLDVTLVGVGGGLSYGMEGITHHGFEDIALMRVLPGMTVTTPGDPVECACIVEESVLYRKPLFIRLGKNNDPRLHSKDTSIKIGKGILVRKGSDICIIASGSALPMGVKLVDDLKSNRVSASLYSMHTIKPLDLDLLNNVACSYRAIFTIEEHSVIGGIGSAVAEFLIEQEYKGKFKRFGLPDSYCTEVGDCAYLRQTVFLTPSDIGKQIMLTLN